MAIIDLDKMGEALNGKADIDLNNTGVFTTNGEGVNLVSSTPAGAETKEVVSADFLPNFVAEKADSQIENKLSQVTSNCITEFPQNLKLELDSRELTLKAGSKVYDGNGLFKTIESDLSIDTSSLYCPCCVYVQSNGTFGARTTSEMMSGDTPPSSGNALFYNTTDKKVYQIENGVNMGTASFPICILTDTDLIAHTFNGIGYIGSTVFVLPGVKGLVPNGRNADGTLNNIEFMTNKVSVYNEYATSSGLSLYFLYPTGEMFSESEEYYVSDTKPEMYHGYWFDTTNNVLWYQSGDGWYKVDAVNIASSVVTAGEVTSFNPKFPFQAVDWSDTKRLTDLSMPSNRYIDLTLGASEATYTAPADGYGLISGTVGVVDIYNANASGLGSCGAGRSGDGFSRRFVPLKKNDTFVVYYDGSFVKNLFRFIYAEGSK